MADEPDPIKRFQALFAKVRRSNMREPTAVTLATADARARPSVRAVLLKGLDQRGFVFYTNRESRKGKQLAFNPHAALCFLWDAFDYQVTVEGSIEPVSDEESDSYWITRDRKSQIGAWASLQSRRLESRSALKLRIAKYVVKFAGRRVPRPPHWSGYRVVPDRIEFWRRRAFRLHERVLYERRGEKWVTQLLYP